MWRLAVALAGCGFSNSVSGVVVDAPADDSMMNGGEPTIITTGFRRTLDVNDGLVSGSHTNFPMLVDLSGTWLRTEANGGRVKFDDSRDIRFSADADGTALLVHEVEAYSPTNGELRAWIRVPTLSSSTVIYMHYGDPAATASGDPKTVWTTSGFAGVWHMHDPIADASGQNTAVTIAQTSAMTGKIGGGRRFDGSSGSIDVGSAAVIDDIFMGGGTVEAWFNMEGPGENGAGRIVEKGGWTITFQNDRLRFYFDWTGSDGDWETPAAPSVNNWHHVAIIYAVGNTASIYLDGTLATNTVSTPTGTPFNDANDPLKIGNRPQDDRTFNGILDELRFSTGSRMPGWITTSYQNQLAPRTFVVPGPEEAH